MNGKAQQVDGDPRTRVRLTVVLALALFVAGVALYAAWRAGSPVAMKPVAQPEVRQELPMTALAKRDGKLFAEGSSAPYRGFMIDRYEDGALKSRSAVSNGQLHGVSEGYFTNGQVQVREEFVAGVQEGMRTTWHANGRKRSEGQVVAGLNEGVYRLWHEDGTLEAEAEFRQGKPHGRSVAWYPSGWLKAEAMMEMGNVKERHTYDDRQRREPGLLARSETK